MDIEIVGCAIEHLLAADARLQKFELGKEKAKIFLTWRKKSEILRRIFEVGHVVSILRSTLRITSCVVPLS